MTSVQLGAAAALLFLLPIACDSWRAAPRPPLQAGPSTVPAKLESREDIRPQVVSAASHRTLINGRLHGRIDHVDGHPTLDLAGWPVRLDTAAGTFARGRLARFFHALELDQPLSPPGEVTGAHAESTGRLRQFVVSVGPEVPERLLAAVRKFFEARGIRFRVHQRPPARRLE